MTMAFHGPDRVSTTRGHIIIIKIGLPANCCKRRLQKTKYKLYGHSAYIIYHTITVYNRTIVENIVTDIIYCSLMVL